MPITEKVFKITTKKHSFLTLAGILESLQILLEEHNIIPTDEDSDELTEADLVIAAQEALNEKYAALQEHAEKTKIILRLQKELNVILSFAAQHASESSKALWQEAVIMASLEELATSRNAPKILNTNISKKLKILDFISKMQRKNIVPGKIKEILSKNATEFKDIKSSYAKYHDAAKDNLTAEVELLTLPNKSVKNSIVRSKSLYKG